MGDNTLLVTFQHGGVVDTRFNFATLDEAKQVYEEIQKAYDAWVAAYGNLIRN
jgi:hypothetical protein